MRPSGLPSTDPFRSTIRRHAGQWRRKCRRRSAQDERSAAVDVDLRLVVGPVAEDGPDDVLVDVARELFDRNAGIVLCGDNDGVRTLRLAELVLDRQL